MSEHDETESGCDFEIPSPGLRALIGDAGFDRLVKETFGLAPRTNRKWDAFDRNPQIYPIVQDELTALRNAVAWLACEVSGHSEKCTCGSCGAVAAAARFMPPGADRDKCQRTKERFDMAMKAQTRGTNNELQAESATVQSPVGQRHSVSGVRHSH